MRDVKLSPAETRDSGKVRLGNMSPSLPAARPASAETADNGKVRMGNMSPSFPAARVERRRHSRTAARSVSAT